MVNTFKQELIGERITLQITKFDLELAKQIFQVVDENREYLSKWLSWATSNKRVEEK